MKLQVSNMVAFILASTQQRRCISLKWFSFITSINPGYWCYPILWFLTWWRWSPFLQKFSSCPWSSLTSVPCCWTDGKSSKLKLPEKNKLGQNVFCRLKGSIWHVSTSAGGNQVRNKIFIPNFFPVSKEKKKNSLYLIYSLSAAASFSCSSQQMFVVIVRDACALMSTCPQIVNEPFDFSLPWWIFTQMSQTCLPLLFFHLSSPHFIRTLYQRTFRDAIKLLAWTTSQHFSMLIIKSTVSCWLQWKKSSLKSNLKINWVHWAAVSGKQNSCGTFA